MASQPGHVVVERLHRVVRRVVGPQLVHQPLRAHHPARLQREQRQQRTPASTRHRDLRALHPQRERAEHVDPQRQRGALDREDPVGSPVRLGALRGHPTKMPQDGGGVTRIVGRGPACGP
ncbi:hypothetical protein [Nocardioides sp. TF02-7]|uniref:hypothetical protein n=1 Tax=Nocardioides sp. TF02-7 TaxID=2917724 RepID=UPI001F060D50|nr:hypothetical protein [Nocardioides sp. TF02-7]UMG92507.1 hypothetical protein MF408_22200 [Nocardioides sp. TF02-7]